MAKLLIPISSLPPISASVISASVGQESYFIRYRIITDDRNVSSYWSNIYQISASSALAVTEPSVSIVSDAVNVAWAPKDDVSEYDVWMSWAASSKSYVQYSINNKSLTSASATITTTINHNLEVGELITVAGVDSVFNGDYIIIAKTANTITYARNYANIASTATTGKVNRAWKYYGRVSTTSLNTFAENTRVSVRIYKATIENNQNQGALLYQKLDAS